MALLVVVCGPSQGKPLRNFKESATHLGEGGESNEIAQQGLAHLKTVSGVEITMERREETRINLQGACKVQG